MDERPLALPLARPLEPSAWLTYAQAAERLGLSPEAVRHRARRAGWRTMPGNDGRKLVLVPDDELTDSRPRAPVRTPDRAPVRTPDHDDQIARAHARAERAEQRADDARLLAERSLALVAEANARADRAEARADVERDKAATRMVQIEAEKRRADQAEAEAARLREADKARRARGILARLGAAIWGE